MLLRYLALFGGIVCMITGCNSLISQQFGTHRLRTVPIAAAVSNGLGDADFVELTDAVVGEAFIVGPALRASDDDYVLRPILTPEQATAWARGQTVTAGIIGWTETEDPACTQPPGCPWPVDAPIRGLLSEPTDKKNPVTNWPAQRIELTPGAIYLQLNEEPMAWYWNLALLLGGILLAILPEAVHHRKQKTGPHRPNAQ